jgi:hypothetical protein
MLEFRNDRLDYGRLLIPPEGYRLDRAIAATYSLDLNTLLSIPVALFYAQTLEGNLQGERFQLLEAIQRTAGIVTVYCQHGQIHVPERYNRLFAFMEEMIIPVKMADAFSSFHPKVWVLRYRPEEPHLRSELGSRCRSGREGRRRAAPEQSSASGFPFLLESDSPCRRLRPLRPRSGSGQI